MLLVADDPALVEVVVPVVDGSEAPLGLDVLNGGVIEEHVA